MERKTRNIIDHLWGPLVGIIVNILVILALLAYVNTDLQAIDEIVQVRHIEATDPEDILEIEEELMEEIEEEILEPLDEEIEFTMDDNFETEFENDQPDEVVESTAEVDASEMSALMSDIASPVTMDNLLVGRSAEGRASALQRYGGGMGGISEPAVVRSLNWLRDHQRPDGGWSQSGSSKNPSNAGITGLALLAFLAHGETPQSADYGDTVTKGLKFLLKSQKADGMIHNSGHGAYAHAMATYALSEAYSMTKLEPLKPAMERAVDVILKGQQKDSGGFDYGYKHVSAKTNKPRNDSSVSGWQIQALKAAYLAGATNDGLKQKLDFAIDSMLANSSKGEGGARGVGYTSPGKRPAISAACLLGLQLTGQRNRKEAKEILDYIKPLLPDPRYTETIGHNHAGVYYQWYYIAQAKFQADADKNGSIFRKFNPLMVKYMLARQDDDGSWCAPDKPLPGKERDEKSLKPKEGIRAQSTALAALTLMVYYRHLPTSQHVSGSVADAAEVLEEEDDAVEIIF